MQKRIFRSILSPISENEPRVKRSLAPATESDHQATRSEHVHDCARHQSKNAPAGDQQILRATLEMHFEDLEVSECAVKVANYIAGRFREHL